MCETQPLRSSPTLPTRWSQHNPPPPTLQPQTFSPSLFGFNPAVFWVVFFGGGWWKHLCGEGLCHLLAVSSSISTFERLNDAFC